MSAIQHIEAKCDWDKVDYAMSEALLNATKEKYLYTFEQCGEHHPKTRRLWKRVQEWTKEVRELESQGLHE